MSIGENRKTPKIAVKKEKQKSFKQELYAFSILNIYQNSSLLTTTHSHKHTQRPFNKRSTTLKLYLNFKKQMSTILLNKNLNKNNNWRKYGQFDQCCY
ncbi:MAG TPA: hypothetical protein PKZ69_07375 [Candidatus Cloacimonadota bacterium]|nr:hypothetical protein [Candidatus Cloacimonadota bacterium]HOQ80095.1 hypothetical protein [Candidatus Cloacimonadota bacterium]HPK41430.1 hypothetical protein [Candidatus Cloacimonadota bacterium]